MTSTVLLGSGVTGNVGSCSIQSTDVDISSFYKETIAVNSCTGTVLADNTYFDWSLILVPALIITIVFSVFAGMTLMFKNT